MSLAHLAPTRQPDRADARPVCQFVNFSAVLRQTFTGVLRRPDDQPVERQHGRRQPEQVDQAGHLVGPVGRNLCRALRRSFAQHVPPQRQHQPAVLRVECRFGRRQHEPDPDFDYISSNRIATVYLAGMTVGSNSLDPFAPCSTSAPTDGVLLSSVALGQTATWNSVSLDAPGQSFDAWSFRDGGPAARGVDNVVLHSRPPLALLGLARQRWPHTPPEIARLRPDERPRRGGIEVSAPPTACSGCTEACRPYPPIIWFGSQVAISGKIASSTIVSSMIATNGIAPSSTVVSGTCGATPLSTYRFAPPAADQPDLHVDGEDHREPD